MSDLQIVNIATFIVDGYYRNFVFVKMEAKGGLVGWGECSLEGKEYAVQGAVQDYARDLLGRDARSIEEHLRTMTRDSFWMNGPVLRSAMGGLEMAMWDLLGKSLGVPVHTLLGGKIWDSIEAYSNAWYFGAKTPDDFAAATELPLNAGYRALKFDPFGYASFVQSTVELRQALDKIAAVRRAVGPDVQIGLDAHGRFGLASALRLVRELEPYDVFFLQEPHPHRPRRAAVLALGLPPSTGDAPGADRTARRDPHRRHPGAKEDRSHGRGLRRGHCRP